MGQAKLRGTKEERVAKAVEKKINQMGLSYAPLDSIYTQFDLPLSAIQVGYIIRINCSDDKNMKFLSRFEKDNDNRIDYLYSAYPGGAFIFEDMDLMAFMAKNIAKFYETDICYLFETERQFEVVPVITVESPLFIDILEKVDE